MNKISMGWAYTRFLFLALSSGSRLKSSGRNFFWPGDLSLANKGRMKLGRGNGFMKGWNIEAEGGVITVGDKNFFNRNLKIACMDRVEIGNRCAFGDSVQIYDHDHRFSEDGRSFREQGYQTAPVQIGDNVWVGARAVILKGVTIGRNSVIGAGAVVTKSIPPDSIAVGVPAKVVKNRNNSP